MKTALRVLQVLIMWVAAIPMVAISYLFFVTEGIVMWKDMRRELKEYTKTWIEMWKAGLNYIVND